MLPELEKREKMPGFDLLCSYEAGIPVYKTRVKVYAQRLLQIPPIPLATLRLISLGLNTPYELGIALGLEPEFIRQGADFLNANMLITGRSDPAPSARLVFHMTENGQAALKNALATTFVTFLEILIDGLTNELLPLSSDRFLYDGADLRKVGTMTLHGAPGTRPSVESLNGRLDQIQNFHSQQQEGLENAPHIIEAIDVGRPLLVFKLVNILAFSNRQDRSVSLRVFDGYTTVPEYDRRLTQRERDGSRVIPDHLLTKAGDYDPPEGLAVKFGETIGQLEAQEHDREDLERQKAELQNMSSQASISEAVVTERTQKIQILEAKLREADEQRKQTKYLKSNEHYDIMCNALRSAEKLTVIISPWITRHAVNQEIIGLIKTAIARGAWILFGYGMPPKKGQSPADYIQEDVRKEFVEIQSGKHGGLFHFEFLANTHAKILVCDQRFCVVTSHNWLSYKGDQGVRQERGVYFENLGMVKEVTNDALMEFKALPTDFPKSLGE